MAEEEEGSQFSAFDWTREEEADPSPPPPPAPKPVIPESKPAPEPRPAEDASASKAKAAYAAPQSIAALTAKLAELSENFAAQGQLVELQKEALDKLELKVQTHAEQQPLVPMLQNRITDLENILSTSRDKLQNLQIETQGHKAEKDTEVESIKKDLKIIHAAAPNGFAKWFSTIEATVSKMDQTVEDIHARQEKEVGNAEIRLRRKIDELWIQALQEGSLSRDDTEKYFASQRQMLQDSFKHLGKTLSQAELPTQKMEDKINKHLGLMSETWEKFLQVFVARENASTGAIGEEAMAKLRTELQVQSEALDQRFSIFGSGWNAKLEEAKNQMQSAQGSFQIKADQVDHKMENIKVDVRNKYRDIEKRLTILQADLDQLARQHSSESQKFSQTATDLVQSMANIYSRHLRPKT